MDRYPPIAEHGLIGDLQTAALVTTDGTIDWFCCPRFDSPSVFASLLDREKGGHFRIAPRATTTSPAAVLPRHGDPDHPVHDRRRRRRGDRLHADRRPATGHRPAPPGPGRARAYAGRCGSCWTASRASTTAARATSWRSTGEGAVFRSAALQLDPARGRRQAWNVTATMSGRPSTCRPGRSDGVVLESAADGPPRRRSPRGAMEMFTDDLAILAGVVGPLDLPWPLARDGRPRQPMTLKLMTYAPTGALVAAPTAGLPEQVGGERNWDYRYTWIRDALLLGPRAARTRVHRRGRRRSCGWLGDRVGEQPARRSGPLKIMYRVDGSSDLDEETLDHFEGYAGSQPGTDRQRRRRPAPARHLRRGDGLDLAGRPARHPGRPRRLDQARQHRRLAVRALGPARRGDLGDPRRPPGLHLRPADVLGRPGPRGPPGR